jgi:hypothetical protein
LCPHLELPSPMLRLVGVRLDVGAIFGDLIIVVEKFR